jgi:hypothetical protein
MGMVTVAPAAGELSGGWLCEGLPFLRGPAHGAGAEASGHAGLAAGGRNVEASHPLQALGLLPSAQDGKQGLYSFCEGQQVRRAMDRTL